MPGGPASLKFCVCARRSCNTAPFPHMDDPFFSLAPPDIRLDLDSRLDHDYYSALLGDAHMSEPNEASPTSTHFQLAHQPASSGGSEQQLLEPTMQPIYQRSLCEILVRATVQHPLLRIAPYLPGMMCYSQKGCPQIAVFTHRNGAGRY